MYERLLVTVILGVFFGGVVLLMKRRQVASAGRASQQLRQANIPTIVYFWSAGCPVCKMTQRRVLDGILAEYGKERLALTAFNTDEAPDVAKEWGVMTLPTTILLDATGTIRHINNGLVVSEDLRRQLAPMILRPQKS